MFHHFIVRKVLRELQQAYRDRLYKIKYELDKVKDKDEFRYKILIQARKETVEKIHILSCIIEDLED